MDPYKNLALRGGIGYNSSAMRSGVPGIFPAFRAAFRGALALFSALAQVNGVRAAFVSCFFALAVFAAQAVAFTPEAQAQERFPLVVTVFGLGAVSIQAGGAPIQSGDSIQANLSVAIVAAPAIESYHVSDWTGPCAAAPKGADGGERTCEFSFDQEDNRVTVTFSPGRLGPHVPVSGNLPDNASGSFHGTGKSELAYFCELFGGPHSGQ